MVRSTEFIQHVQLFVPYPVKASHGFITTEKDGRCFLIDAYSGDMLANPQVPGKHVLSRITSSQCPSCYHYASPEAAFNCMHYVAEGYVHPVRICVVTDFHADEKMAALCHVNRNLGNVDFSPVQLKILSMLVALHENKMPADIQQKIDLVPSQASLLRGSCPFFANNRDMKLALIAKGIARHQRKRHFLDVLKDMQYLKDAHHAIGASYFDRKIAELENQLAKIRAGTA
nr:hypothetical protein [Candidatus Sigynarchaeota archaeon]